MANQKKQPKPDPQAQRQQFTPITLRGFVRGAEQAVEQAKVQMAMKLARGSCGTMEAYNREVGRMEGLDNAMKLIKDMLGQVEEAERNADLPEMTP